MINSKLLTMDTLKHLAERHEAKPHYFGLGFIQLKISKNERIHFYSDELDPILDEEEVHNHRYNFKSSVLKGTLTNEVFYWKESPEPNYWTDPPETEWELAEVSCTPNDSREPTVLLSNIIPIHLATFDTPAGSSYSVTDSMFHRVKWTGNLVTHLQRGPVLEEFAKVIRNKNNPYVCPFSKPLSETETWDWIEKIIGSDD